MKIVSSLKEYNHLYCTHCGKGVLGFYHRNDDITCNLCGEEHNSCNLKYDAISVNTATGWRFPMVLRKEN